MKWFVRGLGVIGVGVWFMGYSSTSGSLIQFGPTELLRVLSWWLETVVSFLILLVGIVLGTLCRGLIELRSAKQEYVNIVDLFRRSFRGVDFWLALFAAPVLWAAIMAGPGGQLPPRQSFFFVLETGFSANVWIASLLQGKPKLPAADPSQP